MRYRLSPASHVQQRRQVTHVEIYRLEEVTDFAALVDATSLEVFSMVTGELGEGQREAAHRRGAEVAQGALTCIRKPRRVGVGDVAKLLQKEQLTHKPVTNGNGAVKPVV